MGRRPINSHPSVDGNLDDPSHRIRPYPERAILPTPTQEASYKEAIKASKLSSFCFGQLFYDVTALMTAKLITGASVAVPLVDLR
jgi:hypothetical protein